MTLKGQARTDYMRGYMRRRRATKRQAKPVECAACAEKDRRIARASSIIHNLYAAHKIEQQRSEPACAMTAAAEEGAAPVPYICDACAAKLTKAKLLVLVAQLQHENFHLWRGHQELFDDYWALMTGEHRSETAPAQPSIPSAPQG